MKACVLCDVGRIEVREVPQPRVGARDVLVRIAAVGICGTDAHIFSGHANYNTDEYGQPIPFDVQPQVLGHEISGYIEAAGSEVEWNVGFGQSRIHLQSFRRGSLCQRDNFHGSFRSPRSH